MTLPRFEQLKRDLLNHIIAIDKKNGTNQGIWTPEQCFNRLVEEVGELARCRRDPGLHRNRQDEPDEEGEVLDIIQTAICYALARGFNLEERWIKDTHSHLPNQQT